MSYSEPSLAGPAVSQDGDGDEVANDAMQLLQIAVFNGLCRTIASLACNGILCPCQLDDIHDSMTAPLDDPDWRDYSFVASTRHVLENVLARAVKDSQEFYAEEKRKGSASE